MQIPGAVFAIDSLNNIHSSRLNNLSFPGRFEVVCSSASWVQLCLDELNHHYDIVKRSQLHAVALAMDPRAKYQWWEAQQWQAETLAEARRHVQQAWEEFKPAAVCVQQSPAPRRSLFGTSGRPWNELEAYLRPAGYRERTRRISTSSPSGDLPWVRL